VPAEFRRISIATLDPLRPAHDLLKDLLDGLRGCWILYQESALKSEIEAALAQRLSKLGTCYRDYAQHNARMLGDLLRI
jgi:hypothetical protein